MPLLIVFIILIGLAGGIQSSGPSPQEVDESQVIISTPSGGLIRSGASERDTTNTSIQLTPANTPTINRPVSGSQPQQELREIPPVIITLAAQNIETNRALLRGELTFREATYSGRLFFIYSTNEGAVRAASPVANQLLVSNYASRSGAYTANLSGLSDDTTYYYRLCFEDTAVRCGNTLVLTTVEDINRYTSYQAPSISTYRAEDIQAENATLRASYRLNDADIITPFLVYGESLVYVNEVARNYDDYDDVRERGDDLQKIRVSRNLGDTGEFIRVIDDLERSTKYYFTFCIAYDDDEARGIKCGYTQSFTTKSRQLDNPTISLVGATVAGRFAQMSATVSMEDYRDGHVFVVYGDDENRVTAVEDTSRFTSIWQSADALQKVSLDVDFDGRDRVIASVRDLASGTQYYRFCVEYEKENDYGYETFVLTCSDTRSFNIF